MIKTNRSFLTCSTLTYTSLFIHSKNSALGQKVLQVIAGSFSISNGEQMTDGFTKKQFLVVDVFFISLCCIYIGPLIKVQHTYFVSLLFTRHHTEDNTIGQKVICIIAGSLYRSYVIYKGKQMTYSFTTETFTFFRSTYCHRKQACCAGCRIKPSTD